jgi:tetratricopeptide (TPR) repeat protein
MKTLALFFAAVLALAGVALAETAPDPSRTVPDPPRTEPDTARTEPEAAPKSKAEQLDELFAKLKTEKDESVAKAAESDILKLWLESGSDTVDLLMGWSIQAMAEKDFSLALDYLDRITVIKPDYAEGWNKRATVYFMLEDYPRSISDIQKVLALEPRHFGALSGLGIIFDSLGQKRRAIEAFEKALDVDPRLDKVREALEKLKKETERET